MPARARAQQARGDEGDEEDQPDRRSTAVTNEPASRRRRAVSRAVGPVGRPGSRRRAPSRSAPASPPASATFLRSALHVRVDGAIGDREAVAPDAVDELRAREDAARRAEQAREQVELDARELEARPCTARAAWPRRR